MKDINHRGRQGKFLPGEKEEARNELAGYPREQFQKLFREFTEREDTIMAWKAGEYSEGVDRLQNFREIAGFVGVNMSSVALLYLLKHIQSIMLAVKTGDYDWDWETGEGEGLKQRIADARNYLILLAACLDEEAEDDPLSAVCSLRKS